MMTGAELIAQERQRQIDEEGFTAEYDDEFITPGQLALAGTCYALNMVEFSQAGRKLKHIPSALMWPWHMRHWKPTPDDPIRQLTKAGALIAAEIDRLERML